MPTCHLCGSPWFDTGLGGRIECCECGVEFKPHGADLVCGGDAPVVDSDRSMR